jgi:hypothetical protein
MFSEIDKANAVPPRPAKVDWAKAAYPNITYFLPYSFNS